MTRYTINQVLDILWNKSGIEEDQFLAMSLTKMMKLMWVSLKAQITILRVLGRRNQMIMILMEAS